MAESAKKVDAGQKPAAKKPDAAEMLAVGPEGPVHEQPLLAWRLKFYPDRDYWRSTQGPYNLLERDRVLTRIKVSSEVLRQWERAAIKAATGQVAPERAP